MKLISDTIEVYDAKGPARAKRYGDTPMNLADPRNFLQGPPHKAFAQMRATAPVAWNEEKAEAQPGFWALSRYEDIMRVNSDPVTFSSQRGGALMAHSRAEMQLAQASLNQMLMMDAPQHMQLRREHMPYFTPAYLKNLSVKVD